MIRDDQHRIACPAPALCPALTGTAVQLNRNPQAGRPAPTSSTFTPSAASPCRVRCGGSSKPRNSERHRPQAVPPWGRWSKIRARRWPRPVPASKAKSPRRRLRPGGDVADVQVPCTRYGDRRPLRGQGFDGAPPQWVGLVGLRPGLLRQVVPKRAVLDAGGSRLYVTKDGSPTRHPASLWSIHATPQPRRCNQRQGAFSLVVGVLSLPASERKPVKPSRGDAESAISPFESGRPVRPWLVVNPGEGAAAP